VFIFDATLLLLLEGEPQPKLNLPWIGPRDDLAKVVIVDVAYWFAVSRVIQSVKELCPELQINAFLNALGAAQGEVEVLFPRSTKIWLRARIIPQRERCRIHKGFSIKPFIQ
jgi:hypothetical protein